MPGPCPDDIEAWLAEVGPVLSALRSTGRPSSSGQREWLAEQARIAAEAIDALECQSFETESAGSPCEELHWLHTRVCALLEGIRRVDLSRSAAA